MTEATKIIEIVQDRVIPGSGFDRCKTAARNATNALRGAGYDARVVRCQGARNEFPNADARWKKLPRSSWTHYLVAVPDLDLAVDTTRRQFDPEAEKIDIRPLKEAEKEWVIFGRT